MEETLPIQGTQRDEGGEGVERYVDALAGGAGEVEGPVRHVIVRRLDPRGRVGGTVGALTADAVKEGVEAVWRVFGPGAWCVQVVGTDGSRSTSRRVEALEGPAWPAPRVDDPLYIDLGRAPPVRPVEAAPVAQGGGPDWSAILEEQRAQIRELTAALAGRAPTQAPTSTLSGQLGEVAQLVAVLNPPSKLAEHAVALVTALGPPLVAGAATVLRERIEAEKSSGKLGAVMAIADQVMTRIGLTKEKDAAGGDDE